MGLLQPLTLPDTTLTLETVDRNLAARSRLLIFEPGLEQRYEADNHVKRTRYAILTALIALFLYDFFLISDWMMLHDVFFEACIIRLGVFTPFVCISVWIVSRSKSVLIREGLSTFAPVLAIVLITIFYLRSNSPYRAAYGHGLVLIMIFASVVQRLRFGYAVAANIGMLAAQLVCLIWSGAFDNAMIMSDMIFFVSAAILLLVANYALERENRLGYLMALRSQLLNKQLERSAKIDPLTGLWNRRHLSDLMEQHWSKAAVSPRNMAVILLDIDHFKLFNDSCGHLEGDVCLQRISRCIQDVVGEDNGVAVRFGGEEFLIFVPDFDEHRVLAMAERLRASVTREAIAHPALGSKATVTASLGVAIGLVPLLSKAALIAAADKALYQAKADGRNRVRASVRSAADTLLPVCAAVA